MQPQAGQNASPPFSAKRIAANALNASSSDMRFATQLNLVPCFTPVASPESNGMSEAFVKTLKRDYLRVSPVPDARTALDQIAGWFDDYNENHPHSGLRMRSPREFRRAHQPAEVSG